MKVDRLTATDPYQSFVSKLRRRSVKASSVNALTPLLRFYLSVRNPPLREQRRRRNTVPRLKMLSSAGDVSNEANRSSRDKDNDSIPG